MKTPAKLLLLFVLLFSLVACSTVDKLIDKIPDGPSDPANPEDPNNPGDDVPDPDPEDLPDFTLNVPDLSLLAGESGAVAVEIDLTDIADDEEISFRLRDVPAELSAELNSTTGSKDEPVSVTVSAAATAAVKTYTFTVEGLLDDIKASADITVEVLPAAAERADYNSFSSTLPGWETFVSSKGAPPGPDTEPTPTGTSVDLGPEVIGNNVYTCSTTPYSLSKTPQKIVALDPDTASLWVGGLIQGEGHVLGIGSLKPLGISERAPATLTIDILSGNNSRTVENPNVATVQQAIADMVSAANASGAVTGGDINFVEQTSDSLSETALDFGLSLNYMGASLATELGYDSSKEKNTIMGNITHTMFTVTLVTPDTPEEFFSSAFTQEDLDRQVELGNMGPTNVPVYVSSVTYGRVLTFSMTSTASEQAMRAALNASYTGGSAELNFSQKKVLRESEIRVTGIGGDINNAVAVIKSGDIKTYFDEAAPLTTAKPISYVIRNIGDNSNALVRETTEYNVTECTVSVDDPSAAIGARIEIELESVRVIENCDSAGAEIYGDFSINGNVAWSQTRNDSINQVKDGDTINFGGIATSLGNYTFGTDRIRITGRLVDKDRGTTADDVIADWSINRAPNSYGTFKKTESNNGCSAELTYTVTKLQDIF